MNKRGAAAPLRRGECKATRATVAMLGTAVALICIHPVGAEANPEPMTEAQRAHVEQELKELRGMRDDMSRSMSQFDARIAALESELQATLPQQNPATPPGAPPPTSPSAAPAAGTVAAAAPRPAEQW